jgi:hypothetical protein
MGSGVQGGEATIVDASLYTDRCDREYERRDNQPCRAGWGMVARLTDHRKWKLRGTR